MAHGAESKEPARLAPASAAAAVALAVDGCRALTAAGDMAAAIMTAVLLDRLQQFIRGGFGRAIITGAGFGIGDDIINKIF
jgi:hypothetical protein